MAQSSNPSFPSRFNAGSGSFSKGFADASPVRPPVLTAQGREDVERLRAKVRAHNPGYVYSNGVSLPSQLPSVPELLDELARNVAGARVHGDVPATPLPEVEPSELAKAGFDWRAIADRAITALEQGSHRPLPLANDPEAASIPGLSVIAASGTTTQPEPESAPSEEARLEEELAVPAEQTVAAPEEATPEFAEPPVEETVLEEPVQEEPTAEETALEETPVVEAVSEPVAEEIPALEEEIPVNYVESSEASPLGEPAALAPMEPLVLPETTIDEATESELETELPLIEEPFDADLPIGELEGEENFSEPDMEVAPPLLPYEEIETGSESTSEPGFETGLEPQIELNEEVASAEEEAATGTLPQSDDLMENRVYDDEVLEPEGNDDELFVGDIEGKPATWEPAEEEATSEEEVVETLTEDTTEEPAEEFGPACAAPSFPMTPEENETEPEVALEESAEAELTEETQPEELVAGETTAEQSVETTDESVVELPQEVPDETWDDTAIDTAMDTSTETPADTATETLEEPEPLLEEALPEATDTTETTENAEPEMLSEDTAEVGVEDLDLAGLDLDALDEIPLEDSVEPEPVEESSEPEPAIDEAILLEEIPTEEGIEAPLPESLPEAFADVTDATEEQSTNFEATPVEPEAETLEPNGPDSSGELPGGVAIGTEAAEAVEEPVADDLEGIDLGEFDFNSEDIPEALPEELPETSLEELPEGVEAAPPSPPEDFFADGETEAVPTLPDESGAGEETAELPFEIPQVQGDIPQAMQEGFPEWTPTSEAPEGDLGVGEPAGADATLFESDSYEGNAPDFGQPVEEKPAKKGFFQKLFGRK